MMIDRPLHGHTCSGFFADDDNSLLTAYEKHAIITLAKVNSAKLIQGRIIKWQMFMILR